MKFFCQGAQETSLPPSPIIPPTHVHKALGPQQSHEPRYTGPFVSLYLGESA